MIKLAVFDVDGTLVTKGNRRVPASCVKALNELSRKGVRLAIASGRPPFAMEQSLLEQDVYKRQTTHAEGIAGGGTGVEAGACLHRIHTQ